MSASPQPALPPTRNLPAFERALLLINSRSGEFLGEESGQVHDRVRQALDHWDRPLALHDVRDEKWIETLASESSRAIVFVAGGDGSLTRVAAHIADSPHALAILPGGTMNLLARDLGIPLEWEEAARAYGNAHERHIDLAEVNGRHFFHSSLMGLFPVLALNREKHRRPPNWTRIPRMMKAVIWAFHEYPRMNISVSENGYRHRYYARALAVTVCSMSASPGELPQRKVLDQGKLGIYIANHQGRFQMAWLTARLYMDLWGHDERLCHLEATECSITFKGKRRMLVGNDGEVSRFSSPLNYRIHPGKLRVIVPAG